MGLRPPDRQWMRCLVSFPIPVLRLSNLPRHAPATRGRRGPDRSAGLHQQRIYRIPSL